MSAPRKVKRFIEKRRKIYGLRRYLIFLYRKYNRNKKFMFLES